MEIVNKTELRYNIRQILESIELGQIFIHPTDTIYGLGCNALDSSCVSKLRNIKGRPNTPFSVIVPSKEWIFKNCEVDKNAEKWIDKLPGPYTLILKLKQKPVAEEVIPGVDTIGVRMPEHWITRLVQQLGKPIVTTSVNQIGKEYMTSLDNIDPAIKKSVQFALYEGEKKGKPSKIIKLDSGEATVLRK